MVKRSTTPDLTVLEPLQPLLIELLKAIRQLDERMTWLERADPLAAHRQHLDQHAAGRRQPFERLGGLLAAIESENEG